MKYNKKIVKLVQERLEHGKREYPDDLNVHDGRDWLIETLEELVDGIIYMTAKILETKEKLKGQKPRQTNPHRFECVLCGNGYSAGSDNLCSMCYEQGYRETDNAIICPCGNIHTGEKNDTKTS